MYPLLAASFALIVRKFPPRSFLKTTSFSTALGVYALSLALDMIGIFLTPDQSTFDRNVSIGMLVALDIPVLFLILFVGRWVINKYVPEAFSLKEMFVLQMLLSAGARIIFTVAGTVLAFVGGSVMTAFGIIGFIFSLYMLLTFQSAVSHVASISKSQAANVIIAPIGVLIVGWLLFLGIVGGYTSIL